MSDFQAAYALGFLLGPLFEQSLRQSIAMQGTPAIFLTRPIPLTLIIAAVVVLLAFITTLNEFLVASIILTAPEDQTLAVGLYQLVSEQLNANWGFFAVQNSGGAHSAGAG